MEWSRIFVTAEIAALIVLVVMVLGHKLEWLPFRAAFIIFALMLLLLVLAALISIVSFFVVALSSASGNSVVWLLSSALGLVPLLAIFASVGQGLIAPKIHDISTRFDPPLEFLRAQTLRRASENALTPVTDKVRSQQVEHYPNIQTLILTNSSVLEVFHAAKDLVSNEGWHLSVANDEDLRFEAVVQSRWFGFKDDVLIEITKTNDTVHVDMRSVSRVGLSDLGANAQRIERFLSALSMALDQS